MEQENKELLLRDLSARLPYGVLFHCYTLDTDERLFGINLLNVETEYTDASPIISVDEEGQEGCYSLDEIKPYLRPLSSMTDAEKEECKRYYFYYEEEFGECLSNDYNTEYQLIWIGSGGDEYDVDKFIDYLISRHFDFRGLIKKGLALEAPEGMYENKRLDN